MRRLDKVDGVDNISRGINIHNPGKNEGMYFAYIGLERDLRAN